MTGGESLQLTFAYKPELSMEKIRELQELTDGRGAITG